MKLSPTVVSLLIAVATATGPTAPALAALDEPGPDQFMITAERVEAEEGPRGRVVRLEENVTITRLGATLRGAHGLYYEAAGHAIIFGDVTGEDGGRTVACDTLDYFLNTDAALLRGNASYCDTSATTTADRIHMLRRENVAICWGNVRSWDEDATFELVAGKLVYDFDAGEGRASREPVLRIYDDCFDVGHSLNENVRFAAFVFILIEIILLIIYYLNKFNGPLEPRVHKTKQHGTRSQ